MHLDGHIVSGLWRAEPQPPFADLSKVWLVCCLFWISQAQPACTALLLTTAVNWSLVGCFTCWATSKSQTLNNALAGNLLHPTWAVLAEGPYRTGRILPSVMQSQGIYWTWLDKWMILLDPTSQYQLPATPLIPVNTSWGLVSCPSRKSFTVHVAGWVKGCLSSLKVCGNEISLCQAGFLEAPTLAWSRSTSLRTTPCRDLAQVPGVAWEAQLVIWGLIKGVLSVWHVN